MNITEEQRKKMLAAAELIDGGDVAVLKKIIEFGDEIEEEKKKIDGLVEGVRTDVEAIKNEAETVISQTKEALVSVTNGLDGEKGEDGKDGRDGKDGKDGKDAPIPDTSKIALEASAMAVEEISPLIPTIEEIENDLPKLGTKIRDGLELLKDDERLDESAIKGLDKREGKLTDSIAKRAFEIVQHQTSFLINKVSNLQDQVNRGGTGGGGSGDMTKAVYDPANISQQLLGTTATQTVSGKRIVQRTGSTTSSASPTIDTDSYDYYEFTAQTTAISLTLSGTPTEGQEIFLAITGTASRAITWPVNAINGAAVLPSTTNGTTRLDVNLKWSSVLSKFRCMAVSGQSVGFQQPTSGTVDGSNAVFVWAIAPNALSVDGGRTIQKTSSDGTVNWTGTTTTTLSVAPTTDIFGLA